MYFSSLFIKRHAVLFWISALILACATPVIVTHAATPSEKPLELVQGDETPTQGLVESTTSDSNATNSPTHTTQVDPTFQAQLQEHRAMLSKKIQERTFNLLQNITGRMNAVVYRFTNIAQRIESRRILLEQEGKMTDDTKNHLAKAREALDATTRILNSDLGAFARAENPRERFVNVRVQIKEAGAYLRDAQAELHMALNGLKENAPSPEATTTSVH